jgi:hypothetical protein
MAVYCLTVSAPLSQPYDVSWNTDDSTVRRNTFYDDRIRSDNDVIAEMNVSDDLGPGIDDNMVPDRRTASTIWVADRTGNRHSVDLDREPG